MKQCWLKRTFKEKVADENYVSGKINCEEKGNLIFHSVLDKTRKKQFPNMKYIRKDFLIYF